MSREPREILQDIKTIALVGISKDTKKDSFVIMKFLIERGYTVFPVNPKYKDELILDRKCYAGLKNIDEKIDMVEIFRKTEFVYEHTKQAIDIQAKVLWTQLNIFCNESKKLAKSAGLEVVMNRCPKIELQQ
tara:strand:+ start:390 stop:785 length:396 start_codon:yes stop_codon:yes gene_type:complete